MFKTLFITAALLLLLHLVAAVSLEQGTLFNTSVSGSAITLSHNATIDSITITNTSILLEGILLSNSSHTYACEDVNHSLVNTTLDSSAFNCSVYVPPAPEEEPESSGSGGGGSAYFLPDEPEKASEASEEQPLETEEPSEELREEQEETTEASADSDVLTEEAEIPPESSDSPSVDESQFSPSFLLLLIALPLAFILIWVIFRKH